MIGSRTIILFQIFCVLVLPSSLHSQGLDSLFQRNKPDTKNISIDATSPNVDVPKAVQVNNGSSVTFHVRKNPIASCGLKFTTEPVQQPNIIDQLFSLLSPLSGGKVAALNALALTPSAGTPIPVDQRLENELQDLADKITAANAEVQAYFNVTSELDKFSRCRDAMEVDICSRRPGEPNDDAATARVSNARDALLQDLNNALALPPLELSTINFTIATLESRVLTRAADTANPPNDVWLGSALSRLRQYRGVLLVLGPDLQNLSLVYNQLKKIKPLLTSLVPNTMASLPAPPKANRLLKGNIVCQNAFTQTSISVPVSITYQNPQAFVLSAGVLVAPFSKRPIGIQSRTTACASGTGNNCIAVTSTSNAQFIPMALGNVYVSGSRTFNFNLAGGLGVNLNNGGTQVEYFAGPSFGIHGFYLTPGVHIARMPKLGNGFVLGQAAPPGVSASTLPISFYSTFHFGIVISHSASPQPKPSGN